MRQFIKIWRADNLKTVIFIDDGINTNFRESVCLEQGKRIKHDLIMAGWVPHREKSMWTPTHVIEFLGFLINLNLGLIITPEHKISVIRDLIKSCLDTQGRLPAKFIAKVTGKIISLEHSHGELVFMRTKFLHMQLARISSWSCKFKLCPESRQELSFWSYYLDKGNGMSILNKPQSDIITYSDASKDALGILTYTKHGEPSFTINRTFDSEEKVSSSTHRELLAVLYGVENLCDIWKDRSIHWFTDSMNVVKVVKRGSMVTSLHKIACKISKLVTKHNITLNLSWICRNDNKQADSLSRIVESDAWSVKRNIFRKICIKYNTIPDYDRFASRDNRQVRKYNSRFFEKETNGVDTFTQSWKGFLNWAVPPIFLVDRTIKFIICEKADTILVVPVWTSAVYWPILLDCISQGLVKEKFIINEAFTHISDYDSIFIRDKKIAALVCYFKFPQVFDAFHNH